MAITEVEHERGKKGLHSTIPPCRHVSPAFIRAFEIGGRNAWEDREEVRELREGRGRGANESYINLPEGKEGLRNKVRVRKKGEEKK